MSNITVVGAGAFGTALATYARSLGHNVRVWCFEEELPAMVKEKGENALYLPGIALDPEITFSTDPDEAACDADLLLFVAPSAHLRRTVSLFTEHSKKVKTILCATKGIEHGTNLLMSQVLAEVLPHAVSKSAFMSGPSFAKDIASGYPTDLSCAAENIETAREIQRMFHSPKFRIYTNDDVTGLELGGSLKNVIAIACGASDALGLGLSARAGLITRGLSEMTRLGVAMGAKAITFQGLSGMGDLILTCTGDLSRNRTLGKQIAEGRKASEIIASQRAVAEGYVTAKPALELGEKYKTDMPITRAVYRVCYEDAELETVIRELMSRSSKDEFKGIE